MTTNLINIGQHAKQAARQLARASTGQKNAALAAIAAGLRVQQEQILAANVQDVADAQANGLDAYLIDRLTLTPVRLNDIASDVRKVAELADPVGKEFDMRRLPNGLHLSRRRVPIGVLGVIYEARPNVTVDVATLCLKTGNASILRGGKETMRSNQALTAVIQAALEQVGLPADAVQSIQDSDRAIMAGLLRLHDYVDMIIPRGGAGLHKFCRENATIPVITGGIGVCHVYVDDTADLQKAVEIVYNAKVQRPSVCNALDTLLVHQAVSERFLPLIAERLAPADVVLHVDTAAQAVLEQAQANIQFVPAGDEDYDREWLSLSLSVRVLSGLDEALDHIAAHGTQHSDAILTDTWSHAQRFLDEVDSSAVFVNASTRFNDGGQFGLGAEVAISTQKLHARGPMGLEELTTYKWIVLGDGQVRA